MRMYEERRLGDRMPDGREPSPNMKPNGLSARDRTVRAGLASVLASIALSGCVVNGYEQSYVPTSQTYDPRVDRVAPAPEQPEVSLVASSDVKATSERLMRRGFDTLGYSIFKSAESMPDSMAIKQAKRLGADLVMIVAPEYAGSYQTTDTVSEPVGSTSSRTTITDRKGRPTGETVTTESTIYATRYVSRTVDLTSYAAMYWVRRKTGIGFLLKELTDEQRRARQTNAGVQITVVFDNSPAERADFMIDDIIESIDGKRIANVQSLGDIPCVSGKALKFVITRGNKQLEKTLVLDELCQRQPYVGSARIGPWTAWGERFVGEWKPWQ